jgi:hypothetical protein
VQFFLSFVLNTDYEREFHTLSEYIVAWLQVYFHTDYILKKDEKRRFRYLSSDDMFTICADRHTALTWYYSYVISLLRDIILIWYSFVKKSPLSILRICVFLSFTSFLFFPFSRFRTLLYNVILCVIWAQLDDGVVEWTSYTEDSGNATHPVCHCNPN